MAMEITWEKAQDMVVRASEVWTDEEISWLRLVLFNKEGLYTKNGNGTNSNNTRQVATIKNNS